MKAIIKVSAVFLLGMFLFTSCNSEPTIQEYYVKNQEKSDFIALDLPASLIQLGDDASEETKATMATIKKLNILAYKLTDDNKDEFKQEVSKVKQILKSDNYQELMRMKHENFNIVINFMGEDDAIDEFVILASANDKGFALARVLGNGMQPEKIIKMANDMKNIDADQASFGQIEELFEDLNF